MSYDSSYRSFLDAVQSGAAVSMAVIGERDMSAGTSWSSLLRTRLQSFNPINTLVVYSADTQTIADHLTNTVSTIAAQNPIPAITLIELGSMATATGSPTTASMVSSLMILANNLSAVGTIPIIMDGAGVYNSTAHDLFSNALEAAGRTNGFFVLRTYHKFVMKRHYDTPTYATLFSDSWRLTVAGHSIVSKEVIEWVSHPYLIKWKNANPILGASYNGSFVTKGDNLELYYDGAQQIYHSTLSGPNLASHTTANAVTELHGDYSTVFKHPRNGEWYCLINPISGGMEYLREFYIWKSLDQGGTWSIMNAGAPVFTETKVTGNPWAYIWNGDIYIDANDVWHLFMDSVDSASAGLNVKIGINYSHATVDNLGAFQANKLSTALTLGGEVTPAVVYVPERNALIMLFSDFSTQAVVGGFSGIGAMTCDLSNAANITDRSQWKWSNAFNMSTPGLHITDPFMAALPAGKDSKIAMGWYHNQAEVYYAFMDLDMPTLYDVLTTDWTAASVQDYANLVSVPLPTVPIVRSPTLNVLLNGAYVPCRLIYRG